MYPVLGAWESSAAVPSVVAIIDQAPPRERRGGIPKMPAVKQLLHKLNPWHKGTFILHPKCVRSVHTSMHTLVYHAKVPVIVTPPTGPDHTTRIHVSKHLKQRARKD